MSLEAKYKHTRWTPQGPFADSISYLTMSHNPFLFLTPPRRDYKSYEAMDTHPFVPSFFTRNQWHVYRLGVALTASCAAWWKKKGNTVAS
jgi:hypothetical protein